MKMRIISSAAIAAAEASTAVRGVTHQRPDMARKAAVAGGKES